MNKMTNLVAEGDRAVMAKTFGMWTSKDAKASELVSWADNRIAIYENWIKNLRKLKDENQLELVNGLSIEELRKLIEAKQQRTDVAQAIDVRGMATAIPFFICMLWIEDLKQRR